MSAGPLPGCRHRLADLQLRRRLRVRRHSGAGGVPGDQLALGVDAALDVPERGRAVVVPAVLVPAHPLQADGLADHERADRGAFVVVDVGGAAAERARALVVDDADAAQVVGVRQAELLGRRVQRGRDLRPGDAVAVLHVPEDDRAVRGHVRDRDVRPDRRVHLVVVLERPAPGLRGRRHRGVDARELARETRRGRALRRDPCRRLARGVALAHAEPEVADRVDLRRIRPLDLQDRGRLDRVVLLRRDDREEVPDAHDLHARDVLDRVGVDGERHRVRAVAVGALPARPNDAAVEHSGHADVGRVGVHAR